MTWLLALSTLLAAGLALVTPAVLRALPAPIDEPEANPYQRLATPTTALIVLGAAAVAGSLVVIITPATAPAWLGLAGPAVLAAVIDARTGYLPKRLAQAAWLLTAAGLLACVGWLGVDALVRAGLGALAAGGLFWVFWRFGGGFGFGDVRLAPVIGAASAVVGWPLLAGALMLGGLLGVAWGVAWRASGRGRAFPYGPALVAGPFLALAGSVLVPGTH